ncbi:MAG: hypothetical protein E6Q97_02455 [Desulfurellales bacterium]|nr:MAG: hypothetical protein E6Q97_02455 [Desulfurellales bacterium]
MATLWVQRITIGNQGVVTVWSDGKQPEAFIFNGDSGAYDALLFERMIDAQLRLITHGRTGLEVVKE